MLSPVSFATVPVVSLYEVGPIVIGSPVTVLSVVVRTGDDVVDNPVKL